jgi:hypothetical protein
MRHGSASRGSRALQLDAAAGAGVVVELDDELESDDLLSPDFDEDEDEDEEAVEDDEVEDDERLSVL